MAVFGKAVDAIMLGVSAYDPPKRISVADGAAQALIIQQPGGYNGPWSPTETPYMIEPMNLLASRRHEAVVFVGPARTGKALDVDTPIPTPDGWTTMGKIRKGDTVFDERGKPTRVVFATGYQHDRECFEVTFSDGEKIIADADHLWGVDRFYWKEPNWRYEVKTTAEILRDYILAKRNGGRKRYRYRIRNAAPIECNHADLPIDPYLLGLWLGDGSTWQAYISCHKDDAQHYAQRFEESGHAVSVVEDKGNTVFVRVDMRYRLTTHCQRGHEFAIVGQAKNGGCKECLRLGHWRRRHGADRNGNSIPPLSMFSVTFSSQLHALGVHGNKHIPEPYLRASSEQRAELLRGLMDTDGCFDKRQGSAEFTTTFPGLRDGFCELARSLGLKPSAKVKHTSWEYKGERKEGVAYRVTFPIPQGFIPFSIPRKRKGFRAAVADVGYRQIISIDPVESRPVKCIQVDSPKRLYLAGRAMIPTHNTLGLLDGWFSRNVTCDPGDMLIVQMSQEKAREFSKTRIDRAIRHSPAVREKMSARGHDDNTHDKLFKHGMWVKIGWPSATQLSSSDYRYVALTDYDRMPDDIDGEGAPYVLALKRTQTFLSRGMCMVESSPGRDIVDPHWERATPHEAPPCSGIVGIYNRSDRRRWYWRCPDCSEYFEAAPGLSLFSLLPPESDLIDIVRSENLPALATEYAKVICPHCGSVIEQRMKPFLNDIRTARWLADGQSIVDGEVVGDPLHSSIAGFWLGGVAAAYQKWDSLLLRYFQGLREYVLTGSELTLKTTVNTDQGMPYLPQHYREAKTSRAPSDRLEDFERFIVPAKTRFIVAAVDVQGGQGARFVVQVHAIGEHLEQWLIDRFEITESARAGVDGGMAPIDPASYPEDWDMLSIRVVLATYRIGDGREMRVRIAAVDTGGEDGVTENAYAWYRRLRAAGHAHRVMLVKGASAKPRSVVVQTMVGSKREGQEPDVPLFLLGTDQIKDAVHGMLHRDQHGPGFVHLPKWLNRAFFDEIKAEIREASGKWKKIRKRNEALDLMCYIRAACIRLGADRFKWDALPPSMNWAAPLDMNADVISSDARREMKEAASNAAPVRRSTKSSYLR